MQYAFINHARVAAQPGLKGSDPGCGDPVIAKCGVRRIHHWSHLNNRECDNWWEPEKEWHREWKNHFPVEWQEAITSVSLEIKVCYSRKLESHLIYTVLETIFPRHG